MPRQGDGSSDNGPFEEAKQAIGHGVEPIDNQADSKVPRADKTAPLPEGRDEKGGAVQGMDASGGRSQGIKEGPDAGQGGSGSSA